MTTRTTIAGALAGTMGVLALSVAALGQTGSGRTPAQADFDACNREAQLGRGGSASPGTAPGAGAPRVGAGPGDRLTGSAAGATGGTGSVTGGSTLRSGSSSPTGDLGLRGMASVGQTDPAYQQAYRDCLKRRGF